MGFDPDAYGNPMQKKRGSAVIRDYSPVRPHPSWGFQEQRPVSQQSSGVSWHSAQSGVVVNMQDENKMEPEYQSEGVAVSEVEPLEAQSHATMEVSQPTPVKTVRQAPRTLGADDYPDFDRTAYGDPSRKNPGQTASRAQEQRRHTVVQDSWQEAGSEPAANLKEARHRSQTSTTAPITPSTVSHFTLDLPQTLPQTPHHNTTPGKMSSSDLTSVSRNVAVQKFTSQPKTYETLKQGNETPQQMIVRLQTAGARDAHQRILRKDQGEIPSTTALALLDLLRQPLPHNADEPQSKVTNSSSQAQSLSNLPNHPGPRKLERPVGSANQDLTEIKIDKKEQRQWEFAKKNPAAHWEQTATHLGNGMSNGWVPAQTSTLDHTNALNNTTTWHEAAVQPVRVTTAQDMSEQRPVENIAVVAPARNQIAQINNHLAKAAPHSTTLRDSRWATAADMKAPRFKPDSNAEGSDETGSDADSTRPMAQGLGRLIRSRKPLVPEERLVGWDGNFVPPPAEWEHRTQFYNNTPEYISGFENWLGDVTIKTMSEKSVAELSFGVISIEEVANLDNHADGIGFAPRETVLEPGNAQRYGHRLVKPLIADPQNPLDFEADARLDLSDPDNVKYKDETAELYINRHKAQIKRSKEDSEAKMREQKEAEQRAQEEEATRVREAADAAAAAAIEMPIALPEATTTKNIYLRPAVEADAPGMVAILNWHITNGIRPSELAPISEEDMVDRMKMSQHARLPFIVAIERTRKTSGTRARRYPRVRPDHPIQNIDPDYIGVSRDEPILGWTSATDWSASDYVETTTAELEVYVSPGHRKSGVGRCLMDAILEATDRGYNKKSVFEFRVAPEMKHMYSCGGGRDLHKLIFQVRSFSKPQTPEHLERTRRAAQVSNVQPFPDPRRMNGRYYNDRANPPAQEPKKDFSKAAKLDDREDDYTIWLKEWLETYGFEEEAHLKMLGTKKSRFVDVRYLTKETCWQPNEGRIPDFTHGY